MGLLDDLLSGLAQGASGSGRPGPGDPDRPMGGGAPGGAGIGGILMALLPVLLSTLAGRQGGGAVPPGPGGSAAGGLGDLLEQFRRRGYGAQADSWVGTGSNLPISPDVLGQVFGRDGLARIAAQAGLSEDEASSGLSQILPDVVDRVTPNGRMPDADALLASVQDLRRRLGA